MNKIYSSTISPLLVLIAVCAFFSVFSQQREQVYRETLHEHHQAINLDEQSPRQAASEPHYSSADPKWEKPISSDFKSHEPSVSIDFKTPQAPQEDEGDFVTIDLSDSQSHAKKVEGLLNVARGIGFINTKQIELSLRLLKKLSDTTGAISTKELDIYAMLPSEIARSILSRPTTEIKELRKILFQQIISDIRHALDGVTTRDNVFTDLEDAHYLTAIKLMTVKPLLGLGEYLKTTSNSKPTGELMISIAHTIENARSLRSLRSSTITLNGDYMHLDDAIVIIKSELDGIIQ